MRSATGYTFLELCVVLVLVGLAASLALPRFGGALFADDLKASVRKLAGTVRALKNDAVRDRTVYRLHMDMTSGRVWYDSDDGGRKEAARRSASLPDGVRILDVHPAGGDKISGGETAIRIDPRGYVQPAVIHVGSDDGDVFTLVLTPFLETIGIVEGYASFEDQ